MLGARLHNKMTAVGSEFRRQRAAVPRAGTGGWSRIFGAAALLALAAGLAPAQTSCAQIACPIVGVLSNSTSQLTFNLPPNTGTSTQTIGLSFQFVLNDPPVYQVNVSNPVSDLNWLTVTPQSGLFSLVNFDGTNFNFTANVTVTVDPSFFSAGRSYTAVISVTAAQQTVATTVVLNVLDPAQLVATPSSLSFSYSQGSAVPATQNLSVTSNPVGEHYAVYSSGSAGGKWLSVPANLTGTTPGTIPVSVNVAGLAVGSYSGSISINPAAGPSLQVPVTLTVTPLTPPVLSVAPPGQTFALPRNGTPIVTELAVSDVGGGTLQFSGSADCTWVKVGAPGSATPGNPAALALTIDPTGLAPQFYTCDVTVTDTGNPADPSQQVAVNLAVSAAPQSITLSQTGLNFTAVADGPEPIAQSLTVSGGGASQLSWSVQTQALGLPAGQPSWLSVSPASGTSAGGSTGTSLTVSVNQDGLAPGIYYGSINVSAPNAANGPQTVSVVLNVQPVAGQGTAPVQVPVAGLVLKGIAGSAVPAQQQIQLFSPGTSPVSFTLTPSVPWLSVTPATGTLTPGVNLFTVFAAPSGLTAGIQRGTLKMSFGDNTSVQLQVAMIAVPLTANASSPVCPANKPASLVAAFRQPANLTTLSQALAQPVQIQLLDDCGNPVTAQNGGSAQVSFSNGDPAVNLTDVGGGLWEGTWIPTNFTGSAFTVQVVGLEPAPGSSAVLSGSASAGVSLLGSSNTRLVGIVNAAIGGHAIAGVAPLGGYVSIYGSLLSGTAASASSVPLPTVLGGTQVLLGGQALPLSYVGPRQINAVIPQGLSPNGTYPLVIVNAPTESVPVPVTVVQYQPGIFATVIAGTSLYPGPVTDGSRPVKSGSEYLTVYCTGLGPVAGPHGEAPPADGTAAPATILYSTTAKVTATIGGVNAPVVFSGLTPTLAALDQVNVQVPAGVQTGSAVPLVLTVTDPNTGASWQSSTVPIAVQ